MTTFPHAEYDRLVEETIVKLKQLGKLKGGEYAGDDDRLANFRRNGDALGLPMEAIWHTYAAKHWDAVTQYIKDIVQDKTRERMEPLAGRLDDIIVYCILFKAMLEERENVRRAALAPAYERYWAAKTRDEERAAVAEIEAWPDSVDDGA